MPLHYQVYRWCPVISTVASFPGRFFLSNWMMGRKKGLVSSAWVMIVHAQLSSPESGEFVHLRKTFINVYRKLGIYFVMLQTLNWIEFCQVVAYREGLTLKSSKKRLSSTSTMVGMHLLGSVQAMASVCVSNFCHSWLTSNWSRQAHFQTIVLLRLSVRPSWPTQLGHTPQHSSITE